MIKNHHSSVFIKVGLIIGCVYILPIVLMLTHLISPEYKYHILVGMSLVLLVYARLVGFTFEELGFRTQNLKTALARVLPLILIVTVIILGLYFLNLFNSGNEPAHWSFYIFYVFVSATLQEFIYRGFLFRAC